MPKHTLERITRDVIATPPQPMVKPDARSPYARFGKREFLYSPSYQSWAREHRPQKASQREQRQ